MSRMKIMIAAALLIASATTASAQEVQVGQTGYLQSAAGGRVFLFKSQDAMFKSVELRKAGADWQVILQYIACIVPTNTKVLDITGDITGAPMSGANGTRDVMVVTGPDAGCKGVVNVKALQK
jgi:hypothetical protein